MRFELIRARSEAHAKTRLKTVQGWQGRPIASRAKLTCLRRRSPCSACVSALRARSISFTTSNITRHRNTDNLCSPESSISIRPADPPRARLGAKREKGERGKREKMKKERKERVKKEKGEQGKREKMKKERKEREKKKKERDRRQRQTSHALTSSLVLTRPLPPFGSHTFAKGLDRPHTTIAGPQKSFYHPHHLPTHTQEHACRIASARVRRRLAVSGVCRSRAHVRRRLAWRAPCRSVATHTQPYDVSTTSPASSFTSVVGVSSAAAGGLCHASSWLCELARRASSARSRARVSVRACMARSVFRLR